jgi:hypothetical protein
MIGLLDRVETSNRPTFLLQIAGDEFGSLPCVPREAFN